MTTNELGITQEVPNLIVGFVNCTKCMEEKPEGESYESWSRLLTGLTPDGEFQVWCTRHRCNVVLFGYVADLVDHFNEELVAGGVMTPPKAEDDLWPISLVRRSKQGIIH